MSYTYPPMEGQSTMELTYDPRNYYDSNNHGGDVHWQAISYHLNDKQSPYQHVPPQVYLTQYNNIGPEWFFFDGYKSPRHMSPSDTYSSPLSEVSTPHDSSSATSVTNYPLVYSPCAVDTVNPLFYETVAKQMDFHQDFSLPEPDNIAQMPFDTHDGSFAFTPQPQPIKDFESELQDEEEPAEIVRAHSSHIAQQIALPQEVEFSTENISTSMVENTPSRKRTWQSETDDELDVEDDNVAVDDVADSDYADKPKPKRRRSSRGSIARTPKQVGRKRNTSIATSSKKPSHDTSLTVANRMAPPVRHKRQLSRQGKKLPKFINKDAPATTLDKKDRSFPCTFHHFGCQSVFPNKNEWKRHVACQHLQLGFYRCDLDGCNPDNHSTLPTSRRTSIKKEEEDEERTVIYNDFNRKDLFTQHARRMHGPTRNASLCSAPPTKKGILQPTKEDEQNFERDLLEIRRRCWMVRRNAPSRSNCGICGRVFDAAYYKEFIGKSHSGGSMSQGPGERQNAEEKAWEERMEHVGRHYEKQDYKNTEEVDDDLTTWGLETGLLVKLDEGKAWLVNVDLPGEMGQTGNDDQEVRKIRRQPSRTVVKQTIKKEEEVAEEVAVTDGEDAPADSD